MFRKILIANRGEIACRIIRTCTQMGIATVAVHSDADADSVATGLADEAVALGGSAAAETYLDIGKIVAAAKQTGADAVHPGYGFLAENAEFAAAVEDAGMTFIGPPPEVIAQMGDKLTAKALAQAAGVAVVPGAAGVSKAGTSKAGTSKGGASKGDALKNAEAAAKAAAEIGFPVMLKAAAGGGGKGMRIARTKTELKEGFRSAASEAKAAFGDGRIFVEKYLENPRHIEVQILADAHGNVIHLGERECSIQRRHQKVIEEAPSPFLSDAARAAMTAQAVALAKAVDYRSAGTVEFIVDAQGDFYFLEMNTRLQVEHPVTEMITGLDLVELMIRVAAGEALPLTQDQVRIDGWAIEARVYAEDPGRGFLPVTGRLVHYREPPVLAGAVRVDSGVAAGSEVGVFYDPLLAKLIAHGPDRAGAIALLRGALDRYHIRGLTHNMGFLAAIAASPQFAAGETHTGLIGELWPDGFAALPPADADEHRRLMAVATVLHTISVARGRRKGDNAGAPGAWAVCLGRECQLVRVEPGGGGYLVTQEGQISEVICDWRPGQALFEGAVDGRDICVQVDRDGVGYRLANGGHELTVRVVAPHIARLMARMPDKAPPDLSRYLLSPMPGLLVSLAVTQGQAVKEGEELAVVEAMKMENVLRAERDAVVAALHVRPGASLAVDETIMEFE